MLKENIQESINSQINAEIYSAYLYLSMSAYFGGINLPGFANWMKVQAQEEMTHAMKFFYYVIDRGGKVELLPIQGPPTQWNSPLEAFIDTLKHEEIVTDRINKMVDLAIAESDHATNNLLQWYVAEQVEEEANPTAIINKLKLSENAPAGIFMIDQELAARVFVDATLTAQA